MAGGNIEFAAYNLNGYDYHAFWSGYSLKALQAQTENTYQRLLELNSFSISQYNFLLGQLIHALTQSADANLNYFEQSLNEEVLINLASQKQDKTRMFVFYIFRGIICFLWNQFDLAYQDFVQARPHISGCQGQFIEAIFYFFDSLSILKSQIGTGGKKEKPELWQRVESNQAKYQLWANHAPMNFLHKWQLVEAEKCRVLGQKAEAIEFYDQAIAGAKANQYLQEEALANELAAQFYGEWGKPKIAQVYLIEAHYGYLQWGALAKVAQLEKQYPQIFERIRELGMPSLPQASNALYAQASVLDLTTVMKASQAIAREIVLEDLLQTLMKILLKNAGAQLGYLLLSTETSGEELNNFYPAIYCNIEQNETQFKFTDSIQNILPISVLKYVIRTQTSIILNQPTQEGHFQQDPYIQALQPLSLVCFPLLNQGQLVGLVYLENNLSLGAFTTERIELLQLLSSQAAIALTNAQLYAQLKESEQQLKQFLEALPIGIGVVDGEGRPYYTNQQAIKILGQGVVPQVSADELSEVYRCYLAGTNEPYPNEKLPVYQALQGKTAYSDDIEIHHADYVIPIETWATPIYSQVGAIQYAIVALQDISERKKAEQTLHLALEKERELNSLRSQFLTMISHEFRTPLTVIGSSIGLINNYGDRLKAEQKEKYINNIQKSVQQITHLLDDIVTISQTEMNEMQCNPVVGDIVAFCKDLVKEIQQLNVGYHLDCVWNLGEINTPQSYFVAFDTRLLRQILVNLLNNAIKYSPDNPVIRFEITAKAQALIFEISDRGIGIPEEEQGSIFETFYRASNVGHIAGIGLGLAITQRCVNLYGGEISLQSRVNEGTTIRVCLPAKLGT
ncbi:MAG: ATP-binding protein [Snowella sp.]|nr:ATP-binding protein [Snowella sp.]